MARVAVAAPGETWPAQDGAPMHALLQLNVGELPVVPDALAGVALLTLFLGPAELPIDAPNGEHWCLRTYPTLDNLVPLDAPERAADSKAPSGAPSTYQPFPVRWSEIEDWPARDDIPHDLLDGWDDVGDDDAPEVARGLKAGGWPATVQHEVGWGGADDVEFVLQVDTDAKTGFEVGWGGALYVGHRRGTGAWVVDWQSM